MEENILNEIVSSEDLKKFERLYLTESRANQLNRDTQFSYAWCLVRSRYTVDIRKGLTLLEDLFTTESPSNENSKRIYLYYLALGNARLKEYSTALKYTRLFRSDEPNNHQIVALENLVKKKLKAEGLKGAALAGSVALAVGGIVGLGIALAKGRK